MLVLLQGGGGGCRLRVTLGGHAVAVAVTGVRFGAGMLVVVVVAQGPAVRKVCALWSRHAGVAAGWRWRVPLEGDAWRACWCCCCHSGVCALERACCWWWWCKVLLSERCVRFGAGMLVLLQGGGGGCRLRVTLGGHAGAVAVTVGYALWSGHAGGGGGAGCCCQKGVRVCVCVRFGARMLVELACC